MLQSHMITNKSEKFDDAGNSHCYKLGDDVCWPLPKEEYKRTLKRYLRSKDINFAFLTELLENGFYVGDVNDLVAAVLSLQPKDDEMLFAVFLRLLTRLVDFKTKLRADVLRKLISLMLEIDSAKIISETLNICMDLDLTVVDSSLQIDFLLHALSQSSTNVKIYAIKLICATPLFLDTPEIHNKTAPLIHDQDPRIRAVALKYMHSYFSRSDNGFDISFDQLKAMLDDDYEEVRLAVLPLLLLMSRRRGSEELNEVKLVDLIFCSLCDSVNDSEVSVRAYAVELLGKMRGIKLQYLLQTLDKKFLVYQGTSGAALNGRKVLSGWMFDESTKHDIELKEDDSNPMKISACGAYIHALEDEYIEVRRPAIKSLCELAASHEKEFAVAAIDFVADMFNDEIEEVRVYAMNGLVSIVNSSEVLISDDQAEIMISALEDSSNEVRVSMRAVLASLHTETRTGLRTIMNGLFTNIRRYPADSYHVWQCAKLIGKNHSQLAQFLINDLFSLHPFFDTPEPDMEDPCYITALIFILNSADCHSDIFSLLPKYAQRHYDFLKIKEPDLVPELIPKTDIEVTSEELNLTEFLDVVLRNCELAERLKHPYFMQLYKSIKSDLEHLRLMDSVFRGLAEFYLLQCDLRLLAKSRFKRVFNFERSLDICRRMLLGFSSHSDEDIKQICFLHFYFHLCFVYNALKENVCDEQTGAEQLNAHAEWLLQMHFPQASSLKQTWYPEKIEEFLKETFPPFFRVSQNLKAIIIDIVEPKENADNPVKFTAGLFTAVKMTIVTENLNSTRNLRIRVLYPDDTVHLIPIASSFLKPYYSSKCRIDKTVLLSHHEWSDASCVEISVGILPDNNICFTASPNDDYVPLSSTLRFHIFPHACKR